MPPRLALSIYEIVGSTLCVASEDGRKVFERISAVLKEGLGVSVSFKNVSSLTPAFLNAALGQLYGTFTADEIRARITVTEVTPEDRALLKRVVDTAKEYFKDPNRFEKARQALASSST